MKAEAKALETQEKEINLILDENISY